MYKLAMMATQLSQQSNFLIIRLCYFTSWLQIAPRVACDITSIQLTLVFIGIHML